MGEFLLVSQIFVAGDGDATSGLGLIFHQRLRCEIGSHATSHYITKNQRFFRKADYIHTYHIPALASNREGGDFVSPFFFFSCM